MNIQDLNKLIKEELDKYLNENEGIDLPEAEDEVTVTTDEEDLEGGADEFKDALDKIRDLINDLLPDAGEPEEEPEDEPEDEEGEDEKDEEGEEEEMDEAVGYDNYTADQVSKVKADADDVSRGLNESIARFQKLANIKG